MDRPSQWPWPLKLLAVVLYGGAMWAVYLALNWFWHKLPAPAVWPTLVLFFAGLAALALYGYLRDRRRRPPRQ